MWLTMLFHLWQWVHPSRQVEPLVATLKGTQYDTGYDLNLLSEIASYFSKLRDKYLASGLMNTKVMGVDINTLIYQVPGGML